MNTITDTELYDWPPDVDEPPVLLGGQGRSSIELGEVLTGMNVLLICVATSAAWVAVVAKVLS